MRLPKKQITFFRLLKLWFIRLRRTPEVDVIERNAW